MKGILYRNDLRVVSGICIAISLVLLFLSFLIFIEKAKSDIRKASGDYNLYLNEIFSENEDIADVISAKYLNLFYSGVCGNDGNDTIGSYYESKLDEKEEKCLLDAVEFSNNLLIQLSDYTLDYRFVISPDLSFGYSFKNKDKRKYSLSTSSVLKKEKDVEVILPDFYKRKLAKDPSQKGTSSTDFYMDMASEEKAYSVVSYIYNSISNRVLGYVIYDHTLSELRGAFERITLNKKYFTAKIINRNNGQMLCFKGDCDRSILKNEINYSLKYNLEIGVSLFSYITETFFLFPLLCLSFIIPFSIWYVQAKKIKNTILSSSKDALTNAYNRKIIPKLIIPSGSSLILMDCKKFKLINDTYGHDAGDEVLIKIVEIVIKLIRGEDIFIRYGGDEFILILPNVEKKYAEEIAIRIKSVIHSTRINRGSDIIKFDINYGIAQIDEKIEEAITIADQRMYENKLNL